MLNTCLSCVHFEDALVQLEPNSVLDVNWGVELDTQLSVNFRMEVDWELFVMTLHVLLRLRLLTRACMHTHGTHRETWNSLTTTPSLLAALSHALSLTHSPTHSLTHSLIHLLTRSPSQSVQTLTD
jgi:hypothetical protein